MFQDCLLNDLLFLNMKNKKNKTVLSSNVSWTIQKGSWAIHFIITILITFFFNQMFGVNTGLQMVVIAYNVISFIFFHWIVGDPFTTEFKQFTFWEQMASQLEESHSLTFLSLYPVLLFLLINRFVYWSLTLFILAFISLILVVVPKLGFMHMKRVFGIKRYD